jgi:hypothetical protein
MAEVRVQWVVWQDEVGRRDTDKAYSNMKELVDEIREAGKYVFRNNKNRLKGYFSSYWKKQNRKKKDDNSEIAE